MVVVLCGVQVNGVWLCRPSGCRNWVCGCRYGFDFLHYLVRWCHLFTLRALCVCVSLDIVALCVGP